MHLPLQCKTVQCQMCTSYYGLLQKSQICSYCLRCATEESNMLLLLLCKTMHLPLRCAKEESNMHLSFKVCNSGVSKMHLPLLCIIIECQLCSYHHGVQQKSQIRTYHGCTTVACQIIYASALPRFSEMVQTPSCFENKLLV